MGKGLKVKEYELRMKNFVMNGSFSFGSVEHIDFGIQYDPSTGIYGRDFYIHLSRPGTELIVQYQAKNEKDIEYGGGYLKIGPKVDNL